MRLSYLEAGAGPLLIFGHGTFGGKALFRTQIESLSSRYRCVAFDWPGHGESAYDPNGWTVQSLVDAVPEFIHALGESSAALAGVSQGGAIFMRTALAHPDVVSALVIMCAGPGRPSSDALASLRTFAGTLQSEGSEALRREAARSFLSHTFHAPGFANAHPAAAAQELDLVLSHHRAAMPLVVQIPAGYESIASRLTEIACPTLVLWGAHDPRLNVASEIAEAIPNAVLRVFPDAGHHLNLDAPDATSAAIGEFLDRLPLTSSV